MNFMRAAIAGKDDEAFPGDDEKAPLDRAANSPPAKTSYASGRTKSSFACGATNSCGEARVGSCTKARGEAGNESQNQAGIAFKALTTSRAQNTASPAPHP